MKTLVAMFLVVLCASGAAAQPGPATVMVEVRAGARPLAGAEVTALGVTYLTDVAGRVEIAVPAGAVEIAVAAAGHAPASAAVSVAAGAPQAVVVELEPVPALEEHVTVVAATRSGRRLEDQPMRVEVLDREEIEEKMLMTPGDIVMMLNEMGGMRVQATSPSLGAASVRVQGMRGRYTRVLSDGLPLFGDVGGLGLLQIPPMDLGQVEVIKGVASALYGAGAMGGVVNLQSRRPGPTAEREFLVNRSARGATDAVAFLAAPLNDRWSASLLAGGHWQDATDVDGDAWADLPGYARAVLRPRLFWDDGAGRTLFATVGVTFEDREGGTLPGRTLTQTGTPFVEALSTRRYDGGAVGQAILGGQWVVNGRAAFARQAHDHAIGDVRERDRHDTLLAEVTVRRAAGPHTLVAGAALERDVYAPRDVPRFAYAFNVPGVFVQHDVDVTPGLALSSSARIDAHSEFGTFFSPRVSALARHGRWSARASVGTGFSAATPLTEETEATGIARLRAAGPLKAERGLGGSLDLSRTDGPFSCTLTLFASRVADPVHVSRDADHTIRNLDEASTNAGVELLGRAALRGWTVTASYTHVRARETTRDRREDVPLTPRHAAGIVAMWEDEEAGRIGLEWYFTGRQRLEENPYRSASEPYVVIGVLAERRVGPLRMFVNGENLSNARQTRWDPMLRSSRAADGRWTVDAWAPLEGRSVNAGVRVSF